MIRLGCVQQNLAIIANRSRIQVMLASILFRPLIAAAIVAILLRVSMFVYASFWPIPNEHGLEISPFNVMGTDLKDYIGATDVYSNLGIFGVLNQYIDYYANFNERAFEYVYYGPLLPYFIHITQYKPGNTFGLSLIFLGMSIVACVLWLNWLKARDISTGWLLVFALLPAPVWFMLSLGTDLPFALFFCIFFLSYFSGSRSNRHATIWLCCAFLMVLTRPNALSILLFVLLDTTLRFWKHRGIEEALALSFSLLLCAFGTAFYFPYFLMFIDNGGSLAYFGVPPSQYHAGIFEWLPAWLDKPLSWLCLGASKLLYLVGLRPSYADVPDYIVVLRATPGLILLPGLVWLLITAEYRLRVFMLIFLAPILLGASQERYILAITPILYVYGVQAILTTIRFVASRQEMPGTAGTTRVQPTAPSAHMASSGEPRSSARTDLRKPPPPDRPQSLAATGSVAPSTKHEPAPQPSADRIPRQFRRS